MTTKIHSGKAVKTKKAATSTHSIACAVGPKLRSLVMGVGGGQLTGWTVCMRGLPLVVRGESDTD